MSFEFDLEAQVSISGTGTVVARADYAEGEPQYLVRYTDENGESREVWVTEGLLEDAE